MFNNDYEGKAFKEIGEHTTDTYERLRSSVNEICQDICKAGEDNYNRRLKEVDIFKKSWEENQKVSEQKAFNQQVQLLRKWKHLVLDIGKVLKANSEKLRASNRSQMHKFLKEFKAIMKRAKDVLEDEWYKLMEVEMKIFDKNEAVIGLYESGLFDIINIFIEKSQTYFTLLRDSETDFIEDITVKLNRYMVDVYQRSNVMSIPPLLRNIVCDKDALSNAIIACHDRHTLAIDTKEDYIVSKLREWHAKETGHLLRAEILRNRKAVLKIRDSVDKSYRLYERKAMVMLNYFKTPEPLFTKTKKKEKRSASEESESLSEEEKSIRIELPEDTDDDQNLKTLTSEVEYDESVDWAKLFDVIMEETEDIRPICDEDIKEAQVVEEEEQVEEAAIIPIETSKVHFVGDSESEAITAEQSEE